MNWCVNEQLSGHADTTAKVGSYLANVELFPEPNREELVMENEHTRILRIIVPAGGRLSFRRVPEATVQWFVVQGRARVRVGRMVKVMSQGDTMFVPAGTVHGLENAGNEALTFTEVRQR